MQDLILIDGHNYLFKSYAVPYKFYSAKGNPLHVATTFLSLVKRTLKASLSENASIIVIFDAQGKTDNHALSETYKQNRKYDYSQEEDSPFDHLPYIKQALDALELNWIEQPGTEADDLIASISHKHINLNKKNKSFIGSNDSDFFQLASSALKIIKLERGGGHTLIDHTMVKSTYQVEPARFVELKSWVGDKSDNIQGIDGIGWKRAAEILNGTRQRNLSETELQILELNKKLIQLNTSLNISFNYSSLEKLLTLTTQEVFSYANL